MPEPVLHICERCEVQHRGDEPRCWLCGGPVVTLRGLLEVGRPNVWEISAGVVDELTYAAAEDGI